LGETSRRFRVLLADDPDLLVNRGDLARRLAF
jgi:hypothetical protein